ncbi:beta-1,4-galactosyltransferase 5-like [Amphiura filiformis]|uniref:beta-1,4-galactosyltransferase 5-like n=1 Tax=Amphiura filiformis TaxID=82378 RepID=UPI003B20C148
MTIDTSEASMFEAEEAIFQTSTLKVRKLVSTANSLVNRLYDAPNGYRPSIEETLADALVLNDYIYVPGGRWVPAHCLPRWKVAIIIPFRDRHYHLPILLKHLVPFLQRQYLEFGIFVAEQANGLQFNRAMLMNVGFVEALNYTHWDCFIFHDVDHIPLNYANYYGCSHMPRHFLSGADRWGYKLLYGGFFGAVTGFTRTQIQRFNGFPNVYWGWGGEDDDILGRIRQLGFFKTRPWGVMGWYNVISQHHESAKKNTARVCLLKHYFERVYSDGLSNLEYSKPNVTLFPLYINIAVDIQHLDWNRSWTECPENPQRIQAAVADAPAAAADKSADAPKRERRGIRADNKKS